MNVYWFICIFCLALIAIINSIAFFIMVIQDFKRYRKRRK